LYRHEHEFGASDWEGKVMQEFFGPTTYSRSLSEALPGRGEEDGGFSGQQD